MSFLITLVSFFVVLATLILVHEFGHFFTAKLFGVRVFEFGLGFPPRVAAVRHNGTVYSLNALPLGGFVKMKGENGEEADEPDSFGAHPWWQRAIILVAGPGMNVLLALLLFFLTMDWIGTPVGTNVVDVVAPHSPAQHAGLRHGDRVIALDGHPTRKLIDLQKLTAEHLGHVVTLTVVRGSHRFHVRLVPRPNPPPNQGPIGVETTVRIDRYSPTVAVVRSFQAVGAVLTAIPSIIQNIGQHGTQNISGPVGIARLTGEAARDVPQTGWGQLFAFVALLSANLGVLNILPIPALDGGRLVLVLVSGIRRKNLNPELEGLIHLVGMALLLTLILLISYQDVVRWLSGE
jgi:regulator of sigma E protease